MFLLSRHVRECGCKTVLTGEGADEFLAGYDIFREAKIRSFWARQPDSHVRPRLFSRVYPYLQLSTRESRTLADAFWKVGLDRAGHAAFSHERRWSSTASLLRFVAPEVRELVGPVSGWDLPVELPREFMNWDELERAQFLEIETLLSGYLLSSQGDRMLMAHGVEGRFPFLDDHVMTLSCSMAPAHKLPGLNEKAVLKRFARDLLPAPILKRPKQPYRAPDAVCFLGPGAPSWTADILSGSALRATNLFMPDAVQHLVRKLSSAYEKNPARPGFSNTDNMALVGIISTQLLHRMMIDDVPEDRSGHSRSWHVTVDAVGSGGPPFQRNRTIGGVL
jgi:asparagine synthase (glutamine-hydrolysing)